MAIYRDAGVFCLSITGTENFQYRPLLARIIFRVIAKGEHDRNKFEYVSFNSKAKQLRMLKSRQPLPNLPFIIPGQKFKYSNRTFSV